MLTPDSEAARIFATTFYILLQLGCFSFSSTYEAGWNLVQKWCFIGLAYQGKDIVFRSIIEYRSLRDFGP